MTTVNEWVYLMNFSNKYENLKVGFWGFVGYPSDLGYLRYLVSIEASKQEIPPIFSYFDFRSPDFWPEMEMAYLDFLVWTFNMQFLTDSIIKGTYSGSAALSIE